METRLKVAILRTLRDARHRMGSAAIAQRLREYGIDLKPRTVRVYLEELCDSGLVSASRRGRSGGRRITARGIAEIGDAAAAARVGMLSAKMDALAWRATFDPATGSGRIVVNFSTLDSRALPRAVREICSVLGHGFGLGRYVGLHHPGERVGENRVPADHIGVGTVCTATVRAALLHACIPNIPRFGGVLELVDGTPIRFTDVITYDGTSLNPNEIFIKSGLLSVREVIRTGTGRIGATLHEIPNAALEEVERLVAQLESAGVGGAIMVGRPDRSVLGFPVQEGRTGLIIPSGLNPLAAVSEAGVPTENVAFAHVCDVQRLMPYNQLAAELGIAVN